LLYAPRQLTYDVGTEDTVYIHLTQVPYIQAEGEIKTQPTQHAVKEWARNGIQPDILLCRAEKDLPLDLKRKIALFCNVSPDRVISAIDVSNIYEVPLNFHAEGLDDRIVERLNIWTRKPDLSVWQKIAEVARSADKTVVLGMVGKYLALKESYKSLNEAISHAGLANRVKVEIRYIDPEDLTKNPQAIAEQFKGVQALIVPGGFGERGAEGKILAIAYAREHRLPFLGICLGMQLSCIEFARNVCRVSTAHSQEFDPSEDQAVIHYMQGQGVEVQKGGTMRLGAYPCVLRAGSLVEKLYGVREIKERHRHRLEFNNQFRDDLESKGLLIAGTSPDGKLVEVVELKGHPFFVGVQYHPEFLSKPSAPHPLFKGLIEAALR